MDVRVYLEKSSVYRSSLKNEPAPFPQRFDRVGLEILEPLCPFCKRRLHGANCSCSEFQRKLKKIGEDFGDNREIHIQVNCSRFSEMLDNLKVSVEKVNAPDGFASIFDSGTTVQSSIFSGDKNSWFISVGEFQGGKLSFYARQRGGNDFYYCVMDNFSCSLKLPDVRFFETFTKMVPNSFDFKRRLGGYRIEHSDENVLQLTYAEFLQKINS